MSDTYDPSESVNHPDPVTITTGGLLSGSGAPLNAIGADGQGYVNTDTGDLYTKAQGVWVLQSGGGGSGVQQLFQGNVDPVNPPTDPSKPALWFNHNTGYGWRWDSVDQAWS